MENLENVEHEGTPTSILDNLNGETETPQDSQPEKKTEEETPTQDGEEAKEKETPEAEESPDEQPSYKQKTEQRFKDLLSQRDEERKEHEEYKTATEQRFKDLERPADSIPADFIELYGTGDSAKDAQAWSLFNKLLSEKTSNVQQNIMTDMQTKADKEKAEGEKYTNWVTNEVDRLKETHQFDENKFKKFMSDNPIVDDKGNLDFNKGISLFEQIHPKKPVDKKPVSVTNSEAGAEQEPKEGWTNEDFGHHYPVKK